MQKFFLHLKSPIEHLKSVLSTASNVPSIATAGVREGIAGVSSKFEKGFYKIECFFTSPQSSPKRRGSYFALLLLDRRKVSLPREIQLADYFNGG